MTHTPGPWKANRAIWDKETGDVAYILEGVKEARAADSYLITAAPDMLEALEEVMGELDVEGLPCPLCGRNLTIGHRHNCIWHVVNATIRKARGKK
jgi:hypothetical protein